MSEFVAVHPETGVEYPVHSKSELVNLIARGYRDGSARKQNKSKSGAGAQSATKQNPTAPEAAKS